MGGICGMCGLEEIRVIRRPETEEIREPEKLEPDPLAEPTPLMAPSPPTELDVSPAGERTLERPENAPTTEPMITPSTPAATAAIPPAVATSLAPMAPARAILAATAR